MTTTTAGPTARRHRIVAERKARPEAEVWLALLELALQSAEEPPWTGLEPRLPPARQADAPLLDGAVVAVDRRTARRWVRGLLKAAAGLTSESAASLQGLRGRLDPIDLLAAAAAEDMAYFEEAASQAGAATDAIVVSFRLAVLPLLRGCADALAGRIPVGWNRGYCPVCGGLPSLAELRGLERTRVLRCARCATGWELPLFVCPFCSERDHRRQFSFAAEGEEQRRRVDACRSCNGYVKTLTTLAPIEPWAVPLDDLATLELDLVASDRGLGRPPNAGFIAAPRVVAADGPWAGLRGGWA